MIQTTEVSITYKGDGVQTSFPYPYPYRNSDDIVGYIINDVGYEKRITNNFKYDKVSNIYQYPLAGEPLAAPYSIKLIRETPQQQNADLPGKLPFSLIEKSLDWIIMILQEIGSRCNSLWHIRNDCKLSETNARNSASAAAESEENAANSEDMAKKWAMSPVSPDGVVDTNSPTGYTQSAKIWAALSKEYAGLSKFKLPIGYYNSVDEMRKSETAIVGRPCVTLGYYEPNDGGGGVYIIRHKKESDVDDGGSIIVLDNGNVAELLIDGPVNVKQFGAKGDGTHDDSIPMVNALSSTKQKDNTLYIPKGTYYIASKLNIGANTHVYGAGINKTILHLIAPLDITGFSNKISDITINSDVQNEYAVIATYISENSGIYNMLIKAENCLKIQQSWYATLHDIQLKSNGGIGLNINANEKGGVNCLNLHGIYINGGMHSVTLTRNQGVTTHSECINLTNCTFENCASTSIINNSGSAQNVKVNTGYFENVGYNGIDIPVYTGDDNPIWLENCSIRTPSKRALTKGKVYVSYIVNYSYYNRLSEDNKGTVIGAVNNIDLTVTNVENVDKYVVNKNYSLVIPDKFLSLEVSTESTPFIRINFRRKATIFITIRMGTGYFFRYVYMAGRNNGEPILMEGAYLNDKLVNTSSYLTALELTSSTPQYDSDKDINYVILSLKKRDDIIENSVFIRLSGYSEEADANVGTEMPS